MLITSDKYTPELLNPFKPITMDKSKIYLDLSKCTEDERKSLPQILEKVGENIYEETLYNLWNLNFNDEYIYLALYFNGDWLRFNSEWLRSNGNLNRTELTYPEFIKLFDGGEGEINVEKLAKEFSDKIHSGQGDYYESGQRLGRLEGFIEGFKKAMEFNSNQ